MIVCSCNVLSETAVRTVLATGGCPHRTSRVYATLGCAAECGRCAITIKRLIDETRSTPR